MTMVPATDAVASSQQVSFWEVHVFVKAILAQANSGAYPLLGTPAWCALAYDDPGKILSVLDAGQHHALRIELAQEAAAEASKAISAAEDWRAVGGAVAQGRGSAYIPRAAG